MANNDFGRPATQIALAKIAPLGLLFVAALMLPVIDRLSDSDNSGGDDLVLYALTFVVPVLVIGCIVMVPLYLQIRLAADPGGVSSGLRVLAVLLTVIDGAWILTAMSTVRSPEDSFFLALLSGFLGIADQRQTMAWLLLVYVITVSLLQLRLTLQLLAFRRP